jgi:(2Fe-2S) ferredoxin
LPDRRGLGPPLAGAQRLGNPGRRPAALPPRMAAQARLDARLPPFRNGRARSVRSGGLIGEVNRFGPGRHGDTLLFEVAVTIPLPDPGGQAEIMFVLVPNLMFHPWDHCGSPLRPPQARERTATARSSCARCNRVRDRPGAVETRWRSVQSPAMANPEGLPPETMAAQFGVGKLARHLFVCLGPTAPTRPRAADVGLPQAAAEGAEPGRQDGPCFRTRCDCLRVCIAGPVAVVYPEGAWYRDVTPENAERIIQEHLIERAGRRGPVLRARRAATRVSVRVEERPPGAADFLVCHGAGSGGVFFFNLVPPPPRPCGADPVPNGRGLGPSEYTRPPRSGGTDKNVLPTSWPLAMERHIHSFDRLRPPVRLPPRRSVWQQDTDGCWRSPASTGSRSSIFRPSVGTLSRSG